MNRNVLNLTEPGVRAALRHDALRGLPRIGRGLFCAVYDKGDTVLKMTCDPIQYGFGTDYTAPQGEHFARLVHDHGDIGENSFGDVIYLYEVEKLAPLRRTSPTALKRTAKYIEREVAACFNTHDAKQRGMSKEGQKVRASHEALMDMSTDEALEESLREALEQVAYFVVNYQAIMDFHWANFMLRGDTLILNDVVTVATRPWLRKYR